MVRAFYCPVCGQKRSWLDAFEKRVEDRSLHDQSRFKTRKVSELCRSCVIDQCPPPGFVSGQSMLEVARS